MKNKRLDNKLFKTSKSLNLYYLNYIMYYFIDYINNRSLVIIKIVK